MKTSSDPALTDSLTKKNRLGHLRSDHTTKEQLNLLKILLLRMGNTPSRSQVDALKRMTAQQAHFTILQLTAAAESAESARLTHPVGPRASSAQLSDWDRWKGALKEPVEAEQLAHVVNLSTAGMQAEISGLKSRFWKQQDFDGNTPQWRRDRNLYSPELEQAGADHRDQEHHRTMAEAAQRHQTDQEASLNAVPDDMRDLLSQ